MAPRLLRTLLVCTLLTATLTSASAQVIPAPPAPAIPERGERSDRPEGSRRSPDGTRSSDGSRTPDGTHPPNRERRGPRRSRSGADRTGPNAGANDAPTGATGAPAAPTDGGTPPAAPAPVTQPPAAAPPPGNTPAPPAAAGGDGSPTGTAPAPAGQATPAPDALATGGTALTAPGAPGTVGIGSNTPAAPVTTPNPAPGDALPANAPATAPPAAGANTPAAPGNGARPGSRTEPGAAVAVREVPSAAPAKTAAAAPPTRHAAPLLPVVDRRVWAPVFARHPLGFDQNTARNAVHDLFGSVEYLAHSPNRAASGIQSLGWGFLACAGGLALLLALLLWGEKKQHGPWRRAWRLARVAGRRNRLWRGVVDIAQRAAVPFLALAVWTFGTLLAEVETGPAVLIQNLLGVWTGFRLVDESCRQLLRRWESAPGPGLYSALHRLLLFAAVWGAGWLLMDAITYREDVIALWIAGGHLVLVVGVFGLLVRRDQILGLLPMEEGRRLSTFRRVVTNAYYPLVYASLIIALLWVIGYQQLASVFLGRSWAVVGICVVAMLAYRSGVQLLERWIQDDPNTRETRDEALSAGRGLFGIAASVVGFGMSLRVLGLRSAVLYAFGQTWLQIGTLRITGHAIWASTILVVGILLVSRWLQAMLAYRLYPALGIGRGEAYALNRLLHYALMVGATLLSLNNLGLSPANIALVLGGLSVGIGFGLQDIANNIASGLILLTSRQVRQGDVISVGERMGTVREVNLRSTMVTTFDNVDLLIPNHKLLGETLINWTHSGTTVRNKIPFGVSYETDPEEVIALALSIAQEHPEVLTDLAPSIFLVQMGDNALQFELFVWVDMAVTPRPRVTTQIYCRLLAEFKARGIEVPFPQRDLHLKSGVPWQELIQGMQASRGNAGDAEAQSTSDDGSVKR